MFIILAYNKVAFNQKIVSYFLPRPWTIFQQVKCFVASVMLLIMISTGAAMGYPTVLLFQLRKNDSTIEIDLDSASWIGSVSGLAGIPSVIMPMVMQWKGRKLAFIMSSTFVLFGWILMYFANSVPTILISESLHGFGGNCLHTVSYFYISEMVIPMYRNVFIQFINICHVLGFTLVGIAIKTVHWRLVSLVFSVPLIVGIVLAFKWPESPFWLAWKGKTDKCEQNFFWLRGKDEESMRELKELIAAQKENRQRERNTNIIKKMYSEVSSRDCYVPGLHIILLFGLNYLGGGMVILLYSVDLIERTAHNENVAFIGAVSINLIVLFGSLANSVLVKYFKNKTVLLTSACGNTIFLLLTSVVTYLQHVRVLSEDSLLCLYCLLGFMVSGILGMFPLTAGITAEIMPVRYRGIGGCISMISTCSFHALTLKTAPYLFKYIGLYGTFLLYSCNVTILSILVWKFVPETKSRTLQEIENFYMYGKFKCKFLKNDDEQEQIDTNNTTLNS